MARWMKHPVYYTLSSSLKEEKTDLIVNVYELLNTFKIVECKSSGSWVSHPQAELQEADAWRQVTPLDAGLGQKTASSMFKRASVKAKIESHVKNLEQQFNGGEGDMEELEKKILSVEEELSKFHKEELMYLEAGGDPLLTCLHCHFQFAHYTSYKQHNCKYIQEPSIKDKVEKFRVVAGRDRELFMNSIKFMSKHRQIQCCVATKTACSGVFPLLFPSQGDKSVSMLQEVGLVGKEAYMALGRALQDGTLHLPTHIVLSLPEGGELYLPPAVLTPTVCAEATSRWRSSLQINICENTMDIQLPIIDNEEEEEEEDDLLDDEDDDHNGEDVWCGQVGGGDGQAAGAGPAGGGQGRRQGRGRPTDQDREVSHPVLQHCNKPPPSCQDGY